MESREWPPRSPDLRPLYFLVYPDDLRDRIESECCHINADVLSYTRKAFRKSIEYKKIKKIWSEMFIVNDCDKIVLYLNPVFFHLYLFVS